jgi:selenium metabolism protein YedF
VETLDLRNLACPEPVIRAKRAIEEHPNSVIELRINSPATVTNVARMARALGAEVASRELPGGEYSLTVTTGQPPAPQPELEPAAADAQAPPQGATILLNNNVLGLGDDRLGRVLMKAFLKTLKSAKPLPREIICLNNGIHLTTEGSEEIPTLLELAELGVDVMSCGTCLDFYGKLDKVRVGIVGNMLDIVTRLNRAAKIITP